MKEEKQKSSVSAGMLGAVFGAIAGGLAVYFADKKRRDDAKTMITDLRHKAEEKVSTIASATKQLVDSSQEALTHAKETITKENEKSKKG